MAIEVVIGLMVIVELVNAAAAAVLVVVCTYCHLVNWSSPLSILWEFPLNTQINSYDTLFWQSNCT